MIADQVQASFPAGVAVPQSVRVLCGYLDEHGYPISGCFEIDTDGGSASRSWFEGDVAMQLGIGVFGRSSTGSTYALWLAREPDPEASPVVLLGSEGEFLPLAVNATEFCRLLGCGYDELEWDDLTQPPDLWNETAPLRAWLHDQLGLECPPTGEAIVNAAREACPDFAAWVTDWQRRSP